MCNCKVSVFWTDRSFYGQRWCHFYPFETTLGWPYSNDGLMMLFTLLTLDSLLFGQMQQSVLHQENGLTGCKQVLPFWQINPFSWCILLCCQNYKTWFQPVNPVFLVHPSLMSKLQNLVSICQTGFPGAGHVGYLEIVLGLPIIRQSYKTCNGVRTKLEDRNLVSSDRSSLPYGVLWYAMRHQNCA